MSELNYDLIDSIQTNCGPLRRTFSEQDLVILHSLVVNAIESMKNDGIDDHPSCANMVEARKMLEHPDNEQPTDLVKSLN